jgi:ubiquinone/menaquinone biosynthesis C-methylase UbiE
MTADGSYKSGRHPLELDDEIARLKAQAQIIWPKELRTLGWFGLRDGMQILEAGSGPGFVTELLLDAMPASTVTALEYDHTLAEYADNYLRSQGHDRYHLIEGSVTDTGLPDNTFDFAYARFLYQHIPDPHAATRELFRVLKPGGVLVVRDNDSGLKTLRLPENPIIEQVYASAAAQQVAWGGNPKIGRQLWHILSSVGFVNLDLELLAVHSDASDVRTIAWLRPEMIEQQIARGKVNAQQATAILQALKEVRADPDYYVLQPTMLVGGQKPLP